jgi:hypothetical protein
LDISEEATEGREGMVTIAIGREGMVTISIGREGMVTTAIGREGMVTMVTIAIVICVLHHIVQHIMNCTMGRTCSTHKER